MKIKNVLGFETQYTIKDAVLDLKSAFKEGELPNSLTDEKYFNIKRMNKLLNKKALEIKLDNRSKYLRQLIVQALIGGGRGHMGSAMSLVEILRVLYDKFIEFDPKNLKKRNRDRFILSKGHGCLALYSILADKKFFSKELTKKKIGCCPFYICLWEKKKEQILYHEKTKEESCDQTKTAIL